MLRDVSKQLFDCVELSLSIVSFFCHRPAEYHVLIYYYRCFVQAVKEICDSRLRTHMLIVLKNIMSLWRKKYGNIPSGSSDSSFTIVDGNKSMELFCIRRVSAKQKKT